ICTELDPQDMLSLYRTNRWLHDALGNPASVREWRAARANVGGMPDCPEWLTEPQFAALCFDKHCQKCLKVIGDGILWQFGARFCTTCFYAS
ncbi:hypothetical protein FKP32DRAFT_1561000, partial [Trametes sanguinea]